MSVAGGEFGPGPVVRERRHDQRWFAGASWAASRSLVLWARYDVVINRSNVANLDAGGDACRFGASCSPLDYDEHVVTVGTTVSW